MLKINEKLSDNYITELISNKKNLLYCNDIYIQTNIPKSTIYTDFGICEHTFDTYMKLDDKWQYCGECFAGEFFDSKKYLIDFNFEIRNSKNELVEYFNGFESITESFIYCKEHILDNLKIYAHPIDEYNNYKDLSDTFKEKQGVLIYDNVKNKVIRNRKETDALVGTLFNEVIARISTYNYGYMDLGMDYINDLKNEHSNKTFNSELVNKRFEKLVNIELSINEYLNLVSLENPNNIRHLDELATYLDSKDIYLENFSLQLEKLVAKSNIPVVKIIEDKTEDTYQDVRLFEIPNSCISKALDISNQKIYNEVAKILVESNGYYYDEEQINDLQIAISNDVRSGNVSYLYTEIENIIINNPSIDENSRKTLINFIDEHIQTMDNRKDKSYMTQSALPQHKNKNMLDIKLK